MNPTAYEAVPRLRTAWSRQHLDRGTVALEFAIIFPIFFTIFYAIVAFSLIFVVQQNLTLAAEEGARAALNYQSATSIGNALAARTTAACVAASNIAASLINGASCTSSWTACNYDTAMDCVCVTLTYNYASSPLVPILPLMNFVLPTSLVSNAMVQLNPENIL